MRLKPSQQATGRSALAALALLMAFAPQPAAAQVRIKMATLVPAGSSWHNVLKETAEKWKTVSGGKVVVTLYPGGVAGDDPDVVRKMRLGTLNAGVLTEVGVAEVDRSVYALGVPMMYSSYDEVYAVLDKMRPKLEASLLAKGFVVLNWADGGWVHFFSKKAVTTPDDLKTVKLFSWAGDDTAVELWKSGGFHPVPLPSTELATALQTGLVDTLGVPPQVAVISQYYKYAPYMTDLSWQLLLGATLINKSSWDQIPADLKPALVAASEEAGKKLQAEMRQSVDRDIEAMKKNGLHVVPVDAKTAALWSKTAESLYPKIRGPIVPADAFDDALRFRDEYRKQHPAAH
ncbi:MAG TPA: TRAP transporter substrate-binding protein DctP [Vicinamibacteria bacterium]|jgi:TRAP-type C4-dicarboxylate transport system substrate-binding protein|nr:TRAP transporter substrate-binding protein DctP [Vicinamibacteria bacterium]